MSLHCRCYALFHFGPGPIFSIVPSASSCNDSLKPYATRNGSLIATPCNAIPVTSHELKSQPCSWMDPHSMRSLPSVPRLKQLKFSNHMSGHFSIAFFVCNLLSIVFLQSNLAPLPIREMSRSLSLFFSNPLDLHGVTCLIIQDLLILNTRRLMTVVSYYVLLPLYHALPKDP